LLTPFKVMAAAPRAHDPQAVRMLQQLAELWTNAGGAELGTVLNDPCQVDCLSNPCC